MAPRLLFLPHGDAQGPWGTGAGGWKSCLGREKSGRILSSASYEQNFMPGQLGQVLFLGPLWSRAQPHWCPWQSRWRHQTGAGPAALHREESACESDFKTPKENTCNICLKAGGNYLRCLWPAHTGYFRGKPSGAHATSRAGGAQPGRRGHLLSCTSRCTELRCPRGRFYFGQRKLCSTLSKQSELKCSQQLIIRVTVASSHTEQLPRSAHSA